MLCSFCGKKLASGVTKCDYCGNERILYCVQCGAPLGASTEICPACHQAQPQPGSMLSMSGGPRYNHPGDPFNITVPPPWTVTERYVLNFPYTHIDRPDVRSGGLKGMAQGFLGTGPAGIQIWLFPLHAGASMADVGIAYTNLQNQFAQTGGSINVMAFDKPFNQQQITLGDVPCLVQDFQHSIFGFSKTIERRFLTLTNSNSGSLGVVMITQASPEEFKRWEKSLWDIATSFRFGVATTLIDSTKVNHMPGLRVPGVDEALGWSWLNDLGQGIFSSARAASESALASQPNSDSLFARGVVHLEQGEYLPALDRFEQAYAATTDPGRKIIIASLAALAERKRNQETPDGLFIFLGKNPATWDERFRSVINNVHAPYALLEASWIQNVLIMAPIWRALVCGSLPDPEGDRRRIGEALGQIAKQCESLGVNTLSRKSTGTLVEVFSNTGDPKAAEGRFQKFSEVFTQAKDSLGLAWCALQRGDCLASLEGYGHPVMLGYRLNSRNNPGVIDRSKIDVSSARAAYNRAKELYEGELAPRGEALVVMRMAYLDGVEHKWRSSLSGYEDAARRFGQSGDNVNRWAAEIGEFWSGAYVQSDVSTLVEKARALAAELRINGAIAAGSGLASALAFAAQEAGVVNNDSETAKKSAFIASEMFSVLGLGSAQNQIQPDQAL